MKHVKMKYPGCQYLSRIIGNFLKVFWASPGIWEIANFSYIPGHSKFDALPSRYRPELEK